MRCLLDRGAVYLSDEFALLDADGRVHAYPRRMTIRTPSGSERLTPDPAAKVTDPPLPVAVIALLQHQAQQAWTVQPVSAADAVLGLIANAVSVRREPARAITAFVAAVEGASVIRGSRGEAAAAADAIEALL